MRSKEHTMEGTPHFGLDLPPRPYPEHYKRVELMLRRFRAACYVTLKQRDMYPPTVRLPKP
jgi:hypothetical protein